jgi:C-methyltransferase C-terminal domain/Putative zinc binding domain/Methyltransferase domain
MLKTRRTCRACGSAALAPVISLGNQYLAGNFAISKDFPPVNRSIPLEVIRCNPEEDESACGLVQLRHTVPPVLMYSAYGYRSGVNETMTRHLGKIARKLEQRVGLKEDDVVVDIGANDGTLLLQYETKGVNLIGFEPSNIRPEGKPLRLRYIHDFFSRATARHVSASHKARIVTSIAMFYDLEDPDDFVAGVADLLSPDGLWVLELSYLPSMLNKNSFETILHEHLEYYSLFALERLLNKHGIVLSDVELTDTNGGSILVTACHAGNQEAKGVEGAAVRIYDLKRREFELELETDRPYATFAANVERIRGELGPLLLDFRASGKRVYGYGASSKGNVILQYCGLGRSHLEGIADRNPVKWGTSTIGTDIPIVSEDEMRRAQPDYLLVLPWHFLSEFRAREHAFLARGGKFILPVPTVSVVA